MAAERDPTSDRHDGPTPNGGVASVAYYRGADGNPAPRSAAVGVEVVELDADDNPVFRTYADLTPPHETE